MISDQEHVCLSFEPKCYGYSRGVAFGECVSADEESRRKRNDNFDEGDLTDRCAHATASLHSQQTQRVVPSQQSQLDLVGR